MEQNPQIKLFKRILEKLCVSSCIFKNASKFIPPKVDLGLRQQLYGNIEYVNVLQNSFESVAPYTIYRFFDEYDCCYIFLCLSKNEEEFLYIGPYLLKPPNKKRIAKICEYLNCDKTTTDFLEQYYSSLPIIDNENIILTLTNCLAQEIFGVEEDLPLEYIDYMIPDKHKPVVSTYSVIEEKENKADLKTIEQIYLNENMLMDAVSTGKLHKVMSVSESKSNQAMKSRLSDSLRDRKNYLVILKTLLRKAAEQGGVHPIHIDKLSSEYANSIENLRTVNQSISLQNEMIRAFCMLVKQHSLKKYSYYVSGAITLVQYDLTADLHLKTISDKLNVNSSYLSDLFHREYGTTLTQFITHERICHGINLMNSTEKTVQQIAIECGILDTSYFIKLFKKQTGMTPNQYRKMIK